MNTNQFRFSAASRKYVENVDLITQLNLSESTAAKRLSRKYMDIISQMRNKTYTDIADFGNNLFLQLKKHWGKDLQQQVTYTQQSWYGVRIHYLWLKRKNYISKNISVALFLPIPERLPIENDLRWREMFEIIIPGRLKVLIYDEGSREVAEHVLRVVENLHLSHVYESYPGECSIQIPLRANDPVKSAFQSLSRLMSQLYD
ncbi:hypothetical protein L0152_21395 [bacterium]|nr:hypothetical protein [bacterium]